MRRYGTFGETKRREYLEALRNGMRRCAAARSVGIDPDTPARHRKIDPTFAEACELAEMEACEIVEDALFEAARSGNVVACQVWLYNRKPSEWRDRRNVDHAGSVQVKIGQYDDEAIAAAAREHALRAAYAAGPSDG